MHENILDAASRLSDDALHARLQDLASCERHSTVELVAHLAVLLGRKKHLGQGWGSVYRWCCDTLHLSHDAAYNRVAAARAVRRFPVILDHLATGFVNVTTVKVLRPILTASNHLEILAEAKYRSRKECELIVARLQPKPDVPSTIRKLPTQPPTPAASLWTQTTGDASAKLASGVQPCGDAPVHPAPTAVQQPVVEPLTPERYRYQFTVSKGTHDKVRHLQDLLCREIPNGDPAVLFDRAVDALTREVEAAKRAATPRPQVPKPATEGSRHIPANVERAVWKRDGNRCAFVGTHGRCAERRFLELHHLQPYAHQGPATADNISVRCRAHNTYESELVFGPWGPQAVSERGEKYAVWREIASSQDGNLVAPLGGAREAVVQG